MIEETNINCTVEALILASPEPVSVKKLCEILEGVTPARIREGIDDLNNIYLGCGNSFRIREVAGGYQMHILPDFEQPIKKMLAKERAIRLSRAALETLAIIAYKQPVTKVEIEHIRGVSTDGVIHNLLERNLIAISGRAESAGRPLLYKTSHEFLKFFGLNRISDLPRMEEIEEMIRMAEPPREQTVLPLSGGNGDRSEDDDDQSGVEAENLDEELIVTVDFSRMTAAASAAAPAGPGGNGDGNDADDQPVRDEVAPPEKSEDFIMEAVDDTETDDLTSQEVPAVESDESRPFSSDD